LRGFVIDVAGFFACHNLRAGFLDRIVGRRDLD
jgi:hypothetical protein